MAVSYVDTNPATGKKYTRATLKSFVKKNRERLLIQVSSRFDGMTDCVQSTGERGFHPVQSNEGEGIQENTLGICGVWLVLGGRDYLYHYETDDLIGIVVSNCCGSFTLAVPKN